VGTSERFAAGMRLRREVLGDPYVDGAMRTADELGAPLQEYITEVAWGTVWSRPGLPRKTRSLLTVAMLTVLNRPHEIAIHVRGALRNGCTPEEIVEVMLQAAVYGGAPAALDGMRVAREVFAKGDGA
jgi:4-carboxymuconolactone decarboxylase